MVKAVIREKDPGLNYQSNKDMWEFVANGQGKGKSYCKVFGQHWGVGN